MMKNRFLFVAMLFAALSMGFVSCDNKGNDPDDPQGEQTEQNGSTENNGGEETPEPADPYNGHEYVDLGLPSGTKWATCNVGATAPEGYGNYYAWGETEPKDYYDWSTYKYGSYDELTKYCTDSDYGKDGFVDNKIILDPEDDAARANWGGQWRMPTDEEWKELFYNCIWIYTYDYNGTGVAGQIVKSKTNGNSIFLPMAGYRSSDYLGSAGDYGAYRSSSLGAGSPGIAWGVSFYSDDVYWYYGVGRCEGHSVRPVLFGESNSDNSSGSVFAPTGTENGHGYVDLGLPSGTKWAICNVGATAPEGYGNYYAWGETEPKTTYNWSTYKWATATYDAYYDRWDLETLTKYNTESIYGTVDNKTVLELADDAARANWGGGWRMPTDAEWTELRENCIWTLTDNYNGTGVEGQIVKSKTNGNHIFLPAAGYRYNSDLNSAGSYGSYWSSSLYTDGPYDAWTLNFDRDGVYRNFYYERCCGGSVRPVLFGE